MTYSTARLLADLVPKKVVYAAIIIKYQCLAQDDLPEGGGDAMDTAMEDFLNWLGSQCWPGPGWGRFSRG